MSANYVVAGHVVAADTASTIMSGSKTAEGFVSFATSVGFPMNWLLMQTTHTTATVDVRVWLKGNANWMDGAAFANNYATQYMLVRITNASSRFSEVRLIGEIWGFNCETAVTGGLLRVTGTGPAPW